jgi:hypothetical protein
MAAGGAGATGSAGAARRGVCVIARGVFQLFRVAMTMMRSVAVRIISGPDSAPRSGDRRYPAGLPQRPERILGRCGGRARRL